MAAGVRTVVWAESAQRALDEVIAYIAHDSQRAAVQILEKALRAGTSPNTLAERGRVVPELNDSNIREVFVFQYRLLYKVEDERAPSSHFSMEPGISRLGDRDNCKDKNMYIPASFRVSDEDTIFSFVERYDFGTIVTSSSTDGMIATHVPVLLSRAGGRSVLLGHVARANGHWRHFDGKTPALAIFQGPHGYVSPSWYATTPAVPTWNYAVVHVYGRPLVTEDRQNTSDVLEALIRKYESHRSHPYRTEELPQSFYEQMVNRIVAFEMPVDRIESQFKLGQNRSQEDREGAINGLIAEGSPGAAALAALMREHAK